MEKNRNLMKGQCEDGEWIIVNGSHFLWKKDRP